MRRGVWEHDGVVGWAIHLAVAVHIDAALASLPALEHEEVSEAVVTLELRTCFWRPDVFPRRLRHVGQRGHGHAAELVLLCPVLVREQVEPITAMIHTVKVPGVARAHPSQACTGAGQVQELYLRGLSRGGHEQQVAQAGRLTHGNAELLVRFFQDRLIHRPLRVLPEDMPLHAVLPELAVQVHIVEAVPLGSPVDRPICPRQGQRCALEAAAWAGGGAQVQRVRIVASKVGRVHVARVVRAAMWARDAAEGPRLAILWVHCEVILVEH
mmetsp:Transcript_46530/g.120408  ORF Transcript_46530/g.120408 Transcript_46530/m.120408 type:complete len:269 (+) Transcript_46530:1125-1931(+)